MVRFLCGIVLHLLLACAGATSSASKDRLLKEFGSTVPRTWFLNLNEKE
jgi:hypothetical protein